MGDAEQKIAKVKEERETFKKDVSPSRKEGKGRLVKKSV